MSHIVQIKAEVRDPAAVQAACQRLGLADPVQQTVRLFNTEVAGLAVQLPGWNYPVVCDLASGRMQFDNYLGHWGNPKELDLFRQAYATEKTKLEVRRRGHSVQEQMLANGSIKLTIQVNGGVA